MVAFSDKVTSKKKAIRKDKIDVEMLLQQLNHTEQMIRVREYGAKV